MIWVRQEETKSSSNSSPSFHRYLHWGQEICGSVSATYALLPKNIICWVLCMLNSILDDTRYFQNGIHLPRKGEPSCEKEGTSFNKVRIEGVSQRWKKGKMVPPRLWCEMLALFLAGWAARHNCASPQRSVNSGSPWKPLQQAWPFPQSGVGCGFLGCLVNKLVRLTFESPGQFLVCRFRLYKRRLLILSSSTLHNIISRK